MFAVAMTLPRFPKSAECGAKQGGPQLAARVPKIIVRPAFVQRP
jgi:hypothetical protein